MRPRSFDGIAGQAHLVGPQGYITRIVRSGKPQSLLFFGPPGCGKTTLAKLYAQSFNLPFTSMSGVLNTVADLKKMLKESHDLPLLRRQTLLFVDEIHRLNRSQQDLFLPFLEDGTLLL